MPQATIELGQGAARRDAHAAVVVERALALFGDIEVVARGIIDEAGDDLALALQRHGNRENRYSVQEVRSAVERVDMPYVAFVRAFDRAALLHQETIAGPSARQFLEQGLFRAPVGRGHEIAGPLDGNLEIFHLAEIALQPAPRLHRGGGHHIHKGGADHRNLGAGRLAQAFGKDDGRLRA